MKVIFLDIDGVLNSIEWMKNNPNVDSMEMVDPKALELLDRLIQETNAVVVISSSWRLGKSLPALHRTLCQAGLSVKSIDRIIGTTRSDIVGCRGDEIKVWLDAVGDAVESFVILDDDTDMGDLRPYLVKTSIEDGLTEDHVDDAKTMLGILR